MASGTNPEGFQPLYDGMPVVIRLQSHEHLLAVIYYSDNDDRLLLERPLHVVFQNIRSSHPSATETNMMRVRTHFERWIALSNAIYYPVHLDHILTIAPLEDAFIELYIEWSDKLYQESHRPQLSNFDTQDIHESSAKPTSRFAPDDATTEEIRQSYFDYILQNYKFKGKPH